MINIIRNHMLLIPGLLRCIDDNLLRFLDSASDYAEIFIVTEKSFSQEVALLVDRYNAKAWYAEDLAGKYQLNLSHFQGAFNQWLKFDYALNQALEWEEANGAKFEFIHRIRTDVTFPDKFHELMVLPLENKDTSNICMLNRHDFCFSARRDALSCLTGLLSFFYNHRNDNAVLAEILKSVNVDQLRHSVIHSANYLDAFAVGILVDNQTPEELNLLLKEKHPSHSEISSFIEAAAAFASSLDDPKYLSRFLSLALDKSALVQCWNFEHHYCYWFPETILARFFNYSRIRTCNYNGLIRLKDSRHATTDFTRNIFRMIDDGNISFLSNSKVDWEQEITGFLANGGALGKLCGILRNLVLNTPVIDPSNCKVLKTIFTIIVCKAHSDMSVYLTKDFRDLAFDKGIELPDSWNSYARSAQDLVALKRFDEAKAKVKEGLDKLPNQIYLLIFANDVYRASGNREKSLEYANSIILLHPGDPIGYVKSAQDLMVLKRFDEAQAKVQEGLIKLPNHINLLQIANDVYRASGNREKSLVYANSLIFHHPGDWSGYGRSAQDLAALKLFDQAQARVEEGLSKIPNHINLLQIANDINKALGMPG